MATNHDVQTDHDHPAGADGLRPELSLREEAERLRIAERIALTAQADALIEAAAARRSLDRAMSEIEALRSLWSATQARLDAERIARAGDRRRRVDAESTAAALQAALAASADRESHLVHERDTARAEVGALRASLSWRASAPLRHLRVRRVLSRFLP